MCGDLPARPNGSVLRTGELRGWDASWPSIAMTIPPGVFPPHPDTVALIRSCAAWLAAERDECRQMGTEQAGRRILVVDLCTGSGFIAVALGALFPDARIEAVDSSPEAVAAASGNVAPLAERPGGPIAVRLGDATRLDALADLVAGADLVVANPPYLPVAATARPTLSDRADRGALFADADGLGVIRGVVPVAAALLRDGGRFAVEHSPGQEPRVMQLIGATGRFTNIASETDQDGNARFVTAIGRFPPTSTYDPTA